MNLRVLKISVTLLMMFLMIQSCEDDDGDETLISTFDSDESHQTGMNCMSCHFSGGDGEGWFTIAGSVYDSTGSIPYPNAIVKLYTESPSSGNPLKVVEVDKNGNFYSTERIDFEVGLFVSVSGESEIFMHSPITDGACNRCHGESTDKIQIK